MEIYEKTHGHLWHFQPLAVKIIIIRNHKSLQRLFCLFPFWKGEKVNPYDPDDPRLTTVKRYKQLILSNFFVTVNACNHRHLVEANLDIESRSDLALCTEVLDGNYHYKVLTNELVPTICPICAAILIQRINNMPLEPKNNHQPGTLNKHQNTPQLCLDLVALTATTSENTDDMIEDYRQCELLL
ncbi:hypothetical protein [Candidatus Sororendozoicomonas aggregata]|uniref:hypothetical protein n=1 Tax=Candidatus Sororendozoicomonas aggregata TaxID=3073239 RepID=UPI002ED14FE4